MKIELAEPEEIKLNMTSMIDIVFQLLIFFILTFRVVAMEGDFSIRMPLASSNADTIDTVVTQIDVQLKAGPNGNISSITVDGRDTFTDPDPTVMFQQLTEYVELKLAGDFDPAADSEIEVEFDIDYALRYKYTVMGIEAVSGRKMPDGSVRKLIEKIKFKDNSRRPI